MFEDISGRTELYRHFDQAGRLLYIGISVSALARLIQHGLGSRWFDEIATVTIERHPSRASAIAAERAAIKAEGPIHNLTHREPARITEAQLAAASQKIAAYYYKYTRENHFEGETESPLSDTEQLEGQ